MHDDFLLHYGQKRRSGRYEYGSGEIPYQHEPWFTWKGQVASYREQGLSDNEIATKLGLNSRQFRDKVTQTSYEEKSAQRQVIVEMTEKGFNNVEIAKTINVSEGTVRNLKKQIQNPKESKLKNTVDVLKAGVEKTGYLDVGVGVERQMGISQEKLRAARKQMIDEGYFEHKVYVKNLSDPSKWITMRVMSKESDIEVVKKNKHLIRDIEQYTNDNGLTYLNMKPPKNIDSKRVKVVYKEEGGADRDGVIEIRRGAEGLDLGKSRYAQVRIAVDGTHYLKGMAMYSDRKFPPGVDILYNVNKTSDVPPHEVFKKQKDNPDNPFGATIQARGQRGYLNPVNEEGDWNKWSSTLSSQVLAKQPEKLAKDRLGAMFETIKAEYDEIVVLDNPIVKKHMADKFIDGLDTKARDLKAQSLARTGQHVLLPFPDMDPTTVYAPNYRNGEQVVLIRHPHGGPFEIASLTVDNTGPAKKLLGNAVDAIGIHPSQAQKLSGADFDGDTVLVIPNNRKQIVSSRSLDGLKGFEPTDYQVEYDTITKARKNIEMGIVTNLLVDATDKGADDYEKAAIVRQTMVVIDSEKHKLDYKQAEFDNNIANLKKKYQTHIDPFTGKETQGASTLMSLAKSEIRINPREKEVWDKESGKMVTKIVTDKVYKMDVVDDARILSSGSPMEEIYAAHANKIKALKVEAVKYSEKIPVPKRDPTMSKIYKDEVASLDIKLDAALRNAPRERRAQLEATKVYYKNKTEDMDKKERERLRSQALAAARSKYKPDPATTKIDLTEREWKAIQDNAISPTKLRQILNFADLDQIKSYATPRPVTKASSVEAQRIKLLSEKGYTLSEIADNLGVSTDTIKRILSE